MNPCSQDKPVVKFGNLEIGKIPRIVGTVHLKSELSRLPELVEKKLVDILELRADQLFQDGGEVVEKSIADIKNTKIPIIATIRKGEGHNFDEGDRAEFFKKLIPEVDAIDIELTAGIRDEVVETAKAHKKSVIVSEHNTEETPPDEEIEKLLSESAASGADVIKVAFLPNSTDDVARLMCLTLKHSKAHHLVTISLGYLGRISRVIAPLFGSCLTYGCIEKPVAPGQMDLESLRTELNRIYKTPQY